jgi:predicted SprT family Zn-dependent metalloprotease
MADVFSLDKLLARLDETGPEGRATRDFLRARRVRVGLRPQPTGARWTALGHIQLNPSTVADEAYALSLIVHEVRHLRQGIFGALSVRGELEAWQEQFAYLKSLTGRYSASPSHEAIIEEMMTLSPDSRADMQRARALMREYAGPKYRIDLLPLFPLIGKGKRHKSLDDPEY